MISILEDPRFGRVTVLEVFFFYIIYLYYEPLIDHCPVMNWAVCSKRQALNE